MCELLHTASANQTCDSTILLWEQAPLALNAQRPPITGVPGAPALGGIRPALSGSGRAAARLDSEQFRSTPRTCRCFCEPSHNPQPRIAPCFLRGGESPF